MARETTPACTCSIVSPVTSGVVAPTDDATPPLLNEPAKMLLPMVSTCRFSLVAFSMRCTAASCQSKEHAETLEKQQLVGPYPLAP
jgi:hypothetical protein